MNLSRRGVIDFLILRDFLHIKIELVARPEFHDCRQMVYGSFKHVIQLGIVLCIVSNPCRLPTAWQQTKKRKQKSLQIEIKPGILLHQLQQGLKNNQRISLAHHTFFTVSAVWIATEISERKVAVSKQTIFSQLFYTC